MVGIVQIMIGVMPLTLLTWLLVFGSSASAVTEGYPLVVSAD
jgi:hypothetical protein